MKLSFDVGAKLGFPRDTARRPNDLAARVADLEREVADMRSQLMPFRKLGPRS